MCWKIADHARDPLSGGIYERTQPSDSLNYAMIHPDGIAVLGGLADAGAPGMVDHLRRAYHHPA
jgi:hypothetical protein